MDKNTVLSIILDKQCFSLEDLRYNSKLGYMLSKSELESFLEIKERLIEEKEPLICNLTLKSFNSKYIFYVKSIYLSNLLTDYYMTLRKDLKENKKFFTDRHIDDIMMSRIYSEIEGTLNIENVPTTHKRVKDVLNNETLTDKNDIIIRNMSNAILFIVKEKPKFNKENLFKLYNILSNNCLDEDDRLNGGYYRNDRVSVGPYDGAPHEKIEELMDSMFAFANDPSNIEKYKDLLPHICHYYFVYVHPYFDYNGRTARMVSFWLTYINNLFVAPLFISEAINENKRAYYTALSNSRDAHNDLTYFLGYIFETSTKFSLIYKNVEEIEKQLNKSGDFLSSSEKMYIKKILVHNADGYFNSKKFVEYINNNITKQGALKILNGLTDYGVLQTSTNKKGEKIYCVNQEMITFKYN